MESQEGNSAPILKEFQIEGTWAPVTPIKPTLTNPRSIFEHRERETGVLSQTYMREFEAQTLLSCSISSAERSVPNVNTFNNNVDNNIWDTHSNSLSIGGRVMERENVGMQRRGLEDCLPHWCNQDRRSMGPQFVSSGQSSYPNFSFSSLELPSNGVRVRDRDNANVVDSSYDESLAQFNNMSFGDLLTMKSSALQPSMASLSSQLGNNSSSSLTDMLFPRWDSQMDGRVLNSSSPSTYQDALHGANQQMNNICRGERPNGAFSLQDMSLCNVLSPPSMKHSKGNNSTFAPPTPDLLWRAERSVTSGNTNPGMEQTPNKQNGLQEYKPAASMVYLPDANNKEVTDTSPGQVSTVVEENHNPDKEGELGIDLNKTPQKKPRRRRYTPKVVRENKPKRTPKPTTTPKATDSKETPKVKRKYVRKNKMTPPSMTTPAEATETIDPKTKQGVVKSCKRSLTFDLNGQVTENSSLHTLEPQPNENAAPSQSIHTVHIGQGEVVEETSEVGIAYDLNHSLHQELKNYMSKPTTDTHENLHLSGNNAEVLSRTDTYQGQKHNYSLSASSDGGIHIRGSKRGRSSITNAKEVDAGNVVANQCTFWEPSPLSLDHPNIHGVPEILFPEICKKKRMEKGQMSHASSTCSAAASEDISLATTAINHPTADPCVSNYYYCSPASYESNAIAINRAEILMRNGQNRAQLLNSWADIARLKKRKRSKGTTCVRDLSALEGIASVSPATPAAKCPRRRKVQTSSDPYLCTSSCMSLSNNVHSCLEALADDTHTTPRSKRGPRKQPSSRSSNIDKANNHWDLVLYDGNHSVKKKRGRKSSQKMYPENKTPSPVSLPTGFERWIRTFSLDTITERLKQLDINRECSEISCQELNALVPYNVNNQEQNAIVLYKRDGSIVPFEGPFEPLRKRRQRAKVELDDETTRVWRLLLENIDNQGINGTDEEKVKWWENERSVFHGRVDSFIARMRLVQGDRRFTPWKGSVLDSVIGVFLTQNVSDHLSSSAFMSLAARFPLKSECSESTLSEVETASLVVEPDVFVVEPEESITWNEKALDPPICDRNSRILHEIDCGEEKEVVDSKEQVGSATDIRVDYSSESSQKAINESRVSKASSPTTDTEGASITGDDRARDDATSSQQSVISSQNSVTSPNFQTVGIMSAFSDSHSGAQAPTTNTQCYYFDPSTSFTGLLKMAESPLLHESYSQIPRQDQCDSRKHFTNDYPEAPSTSSSDYQSHLQIDFHLQATKYVELLETDSRSSDTSRKDENSPVEQSNLTTESTLEDLGKEKSWDAAPISLPENLSLCYVLEGGKMVTQLQEQLVKGPLDNVASSAPRQTSSIGRTFPNASLERANVIESTTGFDRTSNSHKEVDQTPNRSHASAGAFEIVTPSPSKPKSRPGKEKKNAFDWDSLRRDAQADGRTRERTANTRDSLDWEALRRADVSVVADTIKARGMNNMLSERIKDLLERLVRDHGSIDMEWLRDIPPDKAKEYLLSFRGLGLKSVECVRLLTLHHLAFPVDTNVGRIAVRLGWVPLQPLPESLQLHLLEMYPILESIQKYLWPRLCKLDQKTLYELHYHLITFGKVFCTKRQPNCNACPLRGECRHFASAFASARLALPGPEERSIMVSGGGTSSHLHPQANINPLPLPPPFSGNQLSEANLRCNQGASVVPSIPLSLPFPQTVNYLERNSEISNCEPIVEVPASPEPPLEQEPALCDIEDSFYEDPDEIPLITLNMKEFTQTLENYMQGNRELQETAVSRALVALTPEAASIPRPKLKNISRLRTEHYVYELPDAHPLLHGLAKREPDDPCSYLLAIWTPGETANSIQPPERRCSFEDPNILCNEVICAYCSSQREVNSEIVRGTLLIPCRTAMRGSFPLNGTYFQVNEVFADHDSSLNPIEVPRDWLWNLSRRTVYFGTSIPTIFKGLTTEDIQHCFWRGFVCVRGFDHKTRSPRPLMARLHFPASRMPKGAKGKAYADE